MLYKDGSAFRKHQLPPILAPSTGEPAHISDFKSVLSATTHEFWGALLAQPNYEQMIAQPAAAVSDLFFHLLSYSATAEPSSQEKNPDDVDELRHPDAARLVATLKQLKVAASRCLFPRSSPHETGTQTPTRILPPADEAAGHSTSISTDTGAAATAAAGTAANKHGHCCTQPSSAALELLAEVTEAAQRLQEAACTHPPPAQASAAASASKLSSSPTAKPAAAPAGGGMLSSSPAAKPAAGDIGTTSRSRSSTGRRSFVLLRRMTLAVLQVLHQEAGADCRQAVEKV